MRAPSCPAVVIRALVPVDHARVRDLAQIGR